MTDKPRPDDGTAPKGDGESQGGAYPNPHKDREPGFEGGQTDLEYSGPDNPNATTED